MSTQHARRRCRKCDQKVVAYRPGAAHLFHLLMSVMTAGAWIVIWILCAVRIGGWKCGVCGGRV